MLISEYISIHVPAWGTTIDGSARATWLQISIHVPAWGTTGLLLSDARHQQDFNPRSRVGNDMLSPEYLCRITISIHVPAWGTTVSRPCSYPNSPLFQSTFPRGERLDGVSGVPVRIEFQSTFPRGERPIRRKSGTDSWSISIHVPAWGTTVILASRRVE